MKIHQNKATSKAHQSDWIIYCDICGQQCWYSEATLLDVHTGRGGLLVCPKDADPIDYGLVPYVIPPEQPVTETRTSEFMKNTGIVGTTPFDYSTNPMSTGTRHVWNQWYTNWEDIHGNWEDYT